LISGDIHRGTKRCKDKADEDSDSFKKDFQHLKTGRPTHALPSFEMPNPFSVLDNDSEDPPLVIDESSIEHDVLSLTGEGGP
jgi:hypothetical protein